MYYYCIFMYLHRDSWHSSATLPEIFRAFFSVVRQMPDYNSPRRGKARTLPKRFVLFYILLVLCCSVCCLCLNVYCTTATGCQPNCNLTHTHTHAHTHARTHAHTHTQVQIERSRDIFQIDSLLFVEFL
jgi:hypothetical protein